VPNGQQTSHASELDRYLPRSLGRAATLKVRIAEIDKPALQAALLVAVAYYLGAKIGFAFTFQPRPISTLWPPNSLLLAALLLSPVSWWWLLLAAALPAHLAAELQSGVPFTMVMGWFVSNCSEALIGAICIRRLSARPLRFDSFRDVGIFLIFGAFLAPLLSSFFDAALVTLIRWGEGSYWTLVRLRFLSNVLAALTIVPVVMSWAAIGPAAVRSASRLRVAEAVLLLLGLLAVGVLIFDWQEPGPTTTPALLYAPLPFLLWTVVRFGPAGTSTAMLAVVVLATWGATHGQGPFITSSTEENARSVQLFLIALSVPLLLLAAAMEERRKAKEALQVSEQRFSTAFRSCPDPMVIVSLDDGVILDVNARWEAMFGYSRDEAVGHTSVDLDLYVNDAARRTCFSRIASQGGIRDFEVEMRDQSGLVRQAVLAAETVKVGAVPCFIGTIHDVSALRRAERDAREQRQQLTHLTRVALLGQLSGALAHELNQPLTAILSNAQAAQHFLAADQIDPQELGEILRDIVAEDRRAGEVIRKLRALFKRGETQFLLLDVNDLVREVLALAHGDLITRNVAVGTELSERLSPVKADRVQIQQVLLNLILNAAEAMSQNQPDERKLTIETHALIDGGVHVSVRDRGPGIPLDGQQQLFEPFFTTKPEGLGLGLSISRSIVAAHGGRVWGSNNDDRGATFHIVLPPVSAEAVS
jgi:two-component system sensor kinase FixL